MRRAVLDRVKGYDTRLGPGRRIGCEDIDFAYRAIRSGAQGRFSPTVVVYHDPAPRDRSGTNLRGWGAFYAKHVIRGDWLIVKMAYWEMCRIVQGVGGRGADDGRSPGNELGFILTGEAVMLWRMVVSVVTREDAEAPR